MSRNSARQENFLSPTQLRACIVLVCCVAAVILSFLFSWVLLPNLLDGSDDTEYDPSLYPVDTSLGSVLPQGTESSDYMAGTIIIGDKNAVAMQRQNLITLDQFMGADGLSVSNLLREACVYFVNDSNAYTVPQAMVKMKPRRILLLLGSNDVGGTLTAESFIADYRQAVTSLASAYPYCDIIIGSVMPAKAGNAETQTLIDQFNQALAVMCNENNYKFLNSAEVMKNSDGYAVEEYFDANGTMTAAGGNALLLYFRQHPYQTDDRRPDTNDIPQRADQAAAADPQATPSPTPQPFKLVYQVDDATHGSLSTKYENGSSGAKLELEAPELTSVTVEAIPMTGWSFAKWSDGQTSNPRTDVVTRDVSVTAVFEDSRIGVTLDRGDTSMSTGDTLAINANITLGGKAYEKGAEILQWVVNDEYVENCDAYNYEQSGTQLKFTPKQAGTYVIKAGASLNQNLVTAQLTVTVTARETPAPTTIELSGTTTVTEGQSAPLTARVQNGSGQTTWSCDNYSSWTAQGDSVSFSAPPGDYTVRARNNGAEATITVRVTAAEQPPDPPDEGNDGDDEGE